MPELPMQRVAGHTNKAIEDYSALLAELLSGRLVQIKPQLEPGDELSVVYPSAEQALKMKGDMVVAALESLVKSGALRKAFFEKVLSCPECHSMNLRPTTYCPKCGSGNTVRGRILQHTVCKYAGTEEEYLINGRYICPGCHSELQMTGGDHLSLGMQRKCYDCGGIFNAPALKWACRKCSSVTAEDKVIEQNTYYYFLNESSRRVLEFEIQPKRQLVGFLGRLGYEVIIGAKVVGKSGAEHEIDILARRDDGIVSHDVAIGIEVAGDTLPLSSVFTFDDKTYDAGISDKVLITACPLEKEAEKYAAHQGINIVRAHDMDAIFAAHPAAPGKSSARSPFRPESREQLKEHLSRLGYHVLENAPVTGKSGAEHKLDMLAVLDEGLVKHQVAIGIKVQEKPIDLAAVFDFDDMAYDTGIKKKAFVAVPGLTPEALRFARRQRINVFEGGNSAK